MKKTPESVLEALEEGVDAARMALARRLAVEIDDPATAPYVRAQMARALSELLDKLKPADGPPGVDVRALLEEVM